MELLHHILYIQCIQSTLSLIQLNLLSQWLPRFMSLLQDIILPQFMNLPQYQWCPITDQASFQLRLQLIQCT